MSDPVETPEDIERIHDRIQASAARLGWAIGGIDVFPPHGSDRRYARVTLDEGPESSLVVMVLSTEHQQVGEVGGISYGAPSESPFVRVGRFLQTQELTVPDMVEISDAELLLWLEDLGDCDLDQAQAQSTEKRMELYRMALDIVIELQDMDTGDAPDVIQSNRFEREMCVWELNHYVDWRIERRLNRSVSSDLRASLDEEFERLTRELLGVPAVVVHRDFQSHNLMVNHGELTLIDFQDALVGPVVYDVVALLRDSYVTLTTAELQSLLAYWMDAQRVIPGHELDKETMTRWFHLQTVQRKLKDAGRFERFALRDEKAEFLQYLPDTLGYVHHALAELGDFPAIQQLLSLHEPLVSATHTPGS